MRTRREAHACDIDPGDRVLLPSVTDLNGRCYTVDKMTCDLSHAWPRVNLWLHCGPDHRTIQVHYIVKAVIWR